ncbi:MAG: ABC transporter substrate-binding protein [Desulfamplus sp.]|nr:ABC transporter substrate-binding protein [Desulfamplus sp.]
MNKRMVVFSVILLVMLIAFGCLKYFLKPILIGVILPIEMSLGNEENLFMRYYQDTHSKIGIKPVKFIIENPPSKEEEFKQTYKKLDEMGVSAIIGGVLSKDGVWLAEESFRTGIPTLGLTPSSAVLSNKKDAFFRLCATNSSQAKAVGMYYQNIGIKRLVLVTSIENRAYVDPYIKVISENFTGELVQIPFAPNEDTYQSIFNADPDGIFTILAAKDVIQVIKAVREKKPNILIGSSSWGTVEILSLYSGPLLDGVLFFSLGSDLYGEDYKAEIADFEQKYKMKATNGSHYAVSVSHILYDAIREVGYSREAIKAYFETPRIYDTIYGSIAMDQYGDSTGKRITILETMNGKMDKKETVEFK